MYDNILVAVGLPPCRVYVTRYRYRHERKRYFASNPCNLITFKYFVERLGVTEELALKLLENEKALTVGSVRLQLERLYEQESS